MNTKSKLALILGLLALPLALMAKSPESAYLDGYRGRTGIPVPISVVMPELSARYAGQTVTLEFVVDTTGKPEQIASTKPGVDAELLAAVTSAVSQWQFAPALVDGKPVARKVALPVNIVDSFDTATTVAMK